MTYNPYGVSGSIISTPRQVRSSVAWKRSRSRNSSVVVRRADGSIVTPPIISKGTRLARKIKATGKPVTVAPLTQAELRAQALQERKERFAKQLASVHLNAND